MKKILLVFTALLVLTACGGTDKVTNKDVNKFEVESKSAEVIQGEFIFRLVSEKPEYHVGEEVKLYGEIEYTGEEDKVTIMHASSAIHFSLTEKVRDYNIGWTVMEIGKLRELAKGDSYQEEFVKTSVYNADDRSKDLVNFVEDFVRRDDFPAGYYVVDGLADFYLKPENDEEAGESIQIKATIDFKVIE